MEVEYSKMTLYMLKSLKQIKTGFPEGIWYGGRLCKKW